MAGKEFQCPVCQAQLKISWDTESKAAVIEHVEPAPAASDEDLIDHFFNEDEGKANAGDQKQK